MVMLILINPIFAQFKPSKPIFPAESDWEKGFFGYVEYIFVNILGLPQEWVEFPKLLYYYILPILAVVVIVYGFLDTMRIFDNNTINLILSIIIGLMLLISRILPTIVKFVIGVLGPISVVAFGLLFLGGLGYISKRKRGEWGTKSAVISTYHSEADRLKKDLETYRGLHSKLMKRYARTSDDKKRKQIEKKISTLKKEMDNLEVRLEELKDLVDQPG